MSHIDFANVVVMREPSETSGKTLKSLKKIIERKYNVQFSDNLDFWRWTTDNLAEFWGEFWDFTGVICSKKFDQVIDLNVPMDQSPEWFKGAKLNYAENLLKFRDERVALIMAGEEKETERITFSEMYEEARLYAASFRKIGLKKGDRVACYMSNRQEPVLAMLATVSIGAIWTGAIPLQGTQAVLNGLKQVGPKIILTIDRFSNNKEEIDMLYKVKSIVDDLPTLERVIIVPSRKDSKLKDINCIRNGCWLDEFLQTGRNQDGSVPPMTFEQVSFSYPVYISFTSGTSGLPKAITHGCGSLFPSAKDFSLLNDSDRDSIWFSISPVGWVSWNLTVGLSFAGITVVLFEGFPYFLSPTYLWDLVQHLKVSHLLLPSTVLDDIQKLGYAPTKKHDLKDLKLLMTGGTVIKLQNYDFVYQKIKKDLIFSVAYGSTEVMGPLLSADPTLPIYKREISMKCLGNAFDCVNDSGHSVEGEIGNLVISKTSPVLPIGLWNDQDGSVYRRSYFSKIPGMFAMEDYGMVNPITKGYIIYGRSDDILKQRGERFGSIEIYNVVEIFPEVGDSVCVTQSNKEMDERAVLFLKMREGHVFGEDLVNRIRDAIAKELTPRHIPEVIIETSDIPRNANGKKMGSIVKEIINNKPFNSESVINPECLELYKSIPGLQEF